MRHNIREAWGKAHNRGLTLVELMIVVAIIGVLSSAAVLAFQNATTKGQVSQLQSFAMQLKRGQEDFRSRHGSFFPLGGGEVTLTSAGTDPNKELFSNLLGFNDTLPAGVTARVIGGDAADPCATCPAGITPQNRSTWYVIVIEQDLNPTDAGAIVTQVIVANDMIGSTVLNEGE